MSRGVTRGLPCRALTRRVGTSTGTDLIRRVWGDCQVGRQEPSQGLPDSVSFTTSGQGASGRFSRASSQLDIRTTHSSAQAHAQRPTVFASMGHWLPGPQLAASGGQQRYVGGRESGEWDEEEGLGGFRVGEEGEDDLEQEREGRIWQAPPRVRPSSHSCSLPSPSLSLDLC